MTARHQYARESRLCRRSVLFGGSSWLMAWLAVVSVMEMRFGARNMRSEDI